MQRGNGRGRGTPAPGNNQTPPRIQCVTCGRFLMHARFSNRQLESYRTDWRRNRGNVANIPLPECMSCTPGQATELKCTICDVTKGLEQFTRAQRRNPDHAKCRDCQQEIEDDLPNLEDRLEEMTIREDPNRGVSIRGSALSATASSAGKNNSTSRAGTSLNGSGRQAAEQGDGVWIPQSTGSGIDFSNLHPQASRAHEHRSASVSSASTNVTGRTTSSSESTAWGEFQQVPRPSRQSSSPRTSSVASGTRAGTNPGFANIRADWRRQTAEERAEVSRQREERRQREARQNLRVDDDDSDAESFDGDL